MKSHRVGRTFFALEQRIAPAMYTVDSLLDTNTGLGNSGTLRYCITQANAAMGADTINFAVTGTITLGGTQLPAVSDTTGATTISGPGAGSLTIDANQLSRVFETKPGTTVTIDGITIANGRVPGGFGPNAAGNGVFVGGSVTITNSQLTGNSGKAMVNTYGGVFVDNMGSLTVMNSSFTNNSATGGGAIFANNKLTVTNCQFQNNSATFGGAIDNLATTSITDSSITGNFAIGGGAIYNELGGVLTITNSTIVGNSAKNAGGGPGGGIVNANIVTITNSTIAGNTSDNTGGGIDNRANIGAISLTITNSTITGNTAKQGGGIYIGLGFAKITNTIVAANTATSSGPDLSGSATVTFSLIGNTAGTTFKSGSGNNVTNTAALVGTLGSYGGLTQTIPLLPGSKAINAGTSVGAPAADQRGNGRVGTVDIGAFESQGFVLTASGGAGQSAIVNTAFTNPLQVNVSANYSVEPVNGGKVTWSAPMAGASATFSSNPTDIVAGVSAANATANGVVGNYLVAAATLGALAIDFALTNVPTNPAAKVASVEINGGAIQRSRVTEIKVHFDQIVITPAGGDAFQLLRQSDNAKVMLVTAIANDTVTHVALSFSGTIAVDYESLADGLYTLKIAAADVGNANGNLDGNNDGIPGGNYELVGTTMNKLYRLFGDSNGDAAVTSADFGEFRSTFGTNLNLAFDFDNNGNVTSNDFGEFRKRFGLTLP